MKKKKQKNFNLFFIFIICFFVSIMLNSEFLGLTLLLIFISFVYWLSQKKTKKEIILTTTMIIIFICFAFFQNKKFNQQNLNNVLEQQTNFYLLRQNFFTFLEKNYLNQNTLAFIKLMIFNEKTDYINETVRNLKKLNVIHLFTISGMHINLLILVFKKIFKNKILNNILSLIFILFYGYFLKYTISILRIIFSCIFNFFKDNESSFLLSGITLLFIFPNLGTNFGFLLSFGCVLIIFKINKYNIKNFAKILLINLLCNLYSNLILININDYINVFAFVLNFFLAPFVIVLYFFVLLTFLIFPIQKIQNYIYFFIKDTVKFLANTTYFLNFENEWKKLILIIGSCGYNLWISRK